METERAIAYVDGFNLYHAVDALGEPYLKWVNLWALMNSFLREGQTLLAVNYYSAYATWLPVPYARHRQYTSALIAAGVDVHISRFKTIMRDCRRCGAQWKSREEKETDVRMSVDIVADTLVDRCDLSIVVTADSDMKPAISRVRNVPGKKLLMLSPPGRFRRSRDLQPNREIERERIARCLFPREVISNGQTVATRPPEYSPPPGIE